MRKVSTMVAGVTALCAAALTLTPSDAAACGGCFAPNETVTVVTAHRMAVAISPTETTLWDQIQYAGDPEDFVWVLPVQGETLVELADNAFFEALDQASRIQLQGAFPPLRTACPDPCADSRFGGAPSAAADAGTADPGVEVYGEAVVGPYETATIGSEDPDALVTWLRDNDYNVPDSILPVIAHYVEQGLNFAVLRLSPNAGVNQMQPVRISTPGMMPVFPLRMVAAGVEGKVGLELYILAEGRWGAQNFEVEEIDTSELYYDWDTSRFNYGEVFDQTIADAGGRAWVAEYAQPDSRWSSVMDWYETYDDDGTRHSPEEDWAVVTRSLERPYLTKLRTDLAAAFLDEDLILEASTAGDINNFIQVYAERNRPSEPTCPTTCSDPTTGGLVGRPAGGSLFGSGGGRGGDGLCSIQPGSTGGNWLLGAAGVALALGLFARRRRRR